MFESFTDRARRVVVLAQEEARMLNHNYIGTEHILLGLIHEGEGVAAKSLESFLFQVSPTDPVAFLAAAALLVVAAIAASYVAARKAARIDPLSALR